MWYKGKNNRLGIRNQWIHIYTCCQITFSSLPIRGDWTRCNPRAPQALHSMCSQSIMLHIKLWVQQVITDLPFTLESVIQLTFSWTDLEQEVVHLGKNFWTTLKWTKKIIQCHQWKNRFNLAQLSGLSDSMWSEPSSYNSASCRTLTVMQMIFVYSCENCLVEIQLIIERWLWTNFAYVKQISAFMIAYVSALWILFWTS